jgi:hypothetical protein
MYGRGAIRIETHPNTPVISVNAVQISGGRKYVFLLQDTKVQRREIVTGVEMEDGKLFEVRSGLKVGDDVVLAGMDGLSEGTTVRPVRNADVYSGPQTAAAPAPAKSN